MPPRLTFIITGFGPFGPVSANPTQLLLENLQPKGDAARPASPLLAALPPSLAGRVTSATVLPVSLAAARAWAASEAEQQQGGGGGQASLTLALHLGVNAESSGGGFCLEAAAYNTANFRLPDADGACPACGPIEAGVAGGATRTSGVPVERLVERLVRAGAARRVGFGSRCCRPAVAAGSPAVAASPAPLPPPVRVSTCAGRYLCNFLYYLSLGLQGAGRLSLFVHVPPAEAVSIGDQAAFLAALMQACVEELEGV